MAHGLTDDRSMVYAGETPWHGLGVKLPGNATWETVRDLAGFYKVAERPIFAAGVVGALPDRKALVRADSGAYLATVGIDYGVVNFEEMAQAVVTAAGGANAIIHTAGLLGSNGIRGWIMGELPGGAIKVPGYRSEIRRFFTVTSAHDGGTPIVAMNNATAVVCQNTLGAALNEKDGARWSIRHTSGAPARVEAAAEAFRRLATGMERFGELAAHMARVRFGDAEMIRALDQVAPVEPTAKDTHPANVKREEIRHLAQSGKGLEGVRGTAWGAWMAFTEWSDHHSRVRALPADSESTIQARTVAARMNAATFGTGAEFKRETLQVIAGIAGFRLSDAMAAAV